MRVRGKFLAKELSFRKESSAHSPRGMVVLMWDEFGQRNGI